MGLNMDQDLPTLVLLGKQETVLRLAAAATEKALFAFSRPCGCCWVFQYSWVSYEF